MAGLALGAILADRVAARLTSKLTAALGFTLLAAGLALGATMTVASGDAFIATWTAITGVGFGLALATAASSALVDLPKASAGVGSAVMQAVQKAGAPLSAAILGSILASAYHSGLSLAGLPPHAADAARSSVFAGLAVAHQLGSAPLLESVRTAFAHGTDAMLWASAGLAMTGIAVALAFLPWRATASPEPLPATRAGGEGAESPHERVA
jgi:Na+/melibiose symporter-like transporter